MSGVTSLSNHLLIAIPSLADILTSRAVRGHAHSGAADEGALGIVLDETSSR